MSDLTIALAEEIGDTRFFMGREKELRFYLNWVEGTKKLHSKSQALLSRRKMGKTALVQRLFNILFNRRDPKVIPFFYRVQEHPLSTSGFGILFYEAFLSQYLAFLKDMPELVNNPLTLNELETLTEDPAIIRDIKKIEHYAAVSPELVWPHAQSAPHRFATSNDIRIIQFIDEFQFMNRFIFSDRQPTETVNLCHSYMSVAESKYAPLLVTGSYIGWLTTILNHMTARFEDRKLGALTDREALDTVYNYAALTDREVNESTAPYIAELAYNDPFYISQIIRSSKEDLDLTSRDGVRAALQYETTLGEGFIASVWMEYIAEGLARVNDRNGKKIVLYLAKHGDQEVPRDQLARDLNLDISDDALADRLYQLKQADLIAPGSSDFRFKGLGDPIFEVVFRKRFAEEIEQIPSSEVEASFEERMKNTGGRMPATLFRG